MTKKSPDYFDVDKVAAQADAAQTVARYFGVGDDEMNLKGDELRMPCFLQCGKSCPTGDRVLAIQVAHQAKLWKCHNYDCPGKYELQMGRDTDWEKKHQAWIAGGRTGKEPAKWTIPASFHRGVVLYGEQELTPQRVGIKLKQIGLPVVEGPLDQVNLAETLNVPAVAILSNAATDYQIERIAEIAHQVAGGVVTLLYDCDEQGDHGMDRDSVKFAKHCRVQRAWARDMHGGRFAEMQPEHLTMENGGKFLRNFLTRGEVKE